MKKEKNLALIYSAVGHALMHMFAAFYFVIVLAIEKVWLLPYEELLKLWVLGSLLVGVAAIFFIFCSQSFRGLLEIGFMLNLHCQS